MPRNVEIKARVRDVAEIRARAEELSGGPGWIAVELMERLGVEEADLVEGAYADLLGADVR